ncbi:MAG: tetratricopeptide repeat protein [Chitinophagaceae bacterium]|nr:tetratricopeptide repeat protein [Chitinophagaceae bacterium]MCW5906136.1 tetratricopeptide repeat protein [Chitinophagaceae bacterium]
MKNKQLNTVQKLLTFSCSLFTKKAILLSLLVIHFSLFTVHAQKQGQERIDSLQTALKKAKQDNNKVNILNALSEHAGWRKGNYDTALFYAQNALQLAQKLRFKKGESDAYNNIGMIHLYQENYQEALNKFSLSLQTSEQAGDKKEQAIAYLYIGIVYVYQENDAEALKNYAASLKVSQDAGNKEQEAQAYFYIGALYYSKYNFTEALKNYLAELKIREEIGDKKATANTYQNIGDLYREQGNYLEALKTFFVVLKIYETLNDKLNTGGVCTSIGLCYFSLSNYPQALEYLLKALKIDEELGNELGSNSINVGIVYDKSGDYANAIRYYQKALAVFEESSKKAGRVTRGVGVALGNIAGVYLEQGKYSEALEYYQKALKIHEQRQDKADIVRITMNIGNVYYSLGNYTETLKSYLAALKMLEKIDDKYLEVKLSNNIGAVYIQQHKLHEAKKWSEKALRLSMEMRSKDAISSAYDNLSATDSASGNFRGAYNNYKMYILYKDSIYNEENTKKFTQTSMQYEFDKKQLADSLQNVQVKKLAAEKLSKQKTYTTLGAALAFILLGFSFFIFRNNKKLDKEKKKSENLLLNILPTEVAEELKEKGSADAKQFDEVSVLFTDFVHFTQTSEQLSPQQLVQELNECFTAFDNIIEQNGLEKIKTIGDAYLAVCGLPNENEQHAKKTVQAALEIRDFIAKRKQTEKTFDIRIGIHSGSVVAGIVGVKKFAYDIWGDTVNTAARMESSGEAGKINISAKTYQLIKDEFEFEYRGKIDAKGKGEIDMYFVS